MNTDARSQQSQRFRNGGIVEDQNNSSNINQEKKISVLLLIPNDDNATVIAMRRGWISSAPKP